jgi:hypothetical protein
MAKYLLTCACGENVVVVDAQAGRRTTCRCGETIEIPTLRKLRHLPPAPADAINPSRVRSANPSRAWSVREGVFATAIICAVFAATVGGYFWWTVPQPQEFNPVHRAEYVDQHLAVLTPLEAWKLWIENYRYLGQAGFVEYQPPNVPLILQIQQRHQFFYLPLFTIAILALICALVIACQRGAKPRQRDS